ncbi:hypothetical protein [Flavobacterium sp.]|uniref:hypothetical protein n=1 Tax=Flavobacterium sp. TaxID=239 RepID=UPI002C63094B|nr:hypothetical protein [Flavobacterium sp.]HSD06535.1 hypothetical protein [Flavobacterium sp.]
MRTTGFVMFLIGAFSTLNEAIGVITNGLPIYVGVAFIILGALLMVCADKKKAETARKKELDKLYPMNTESANLTHTPIENTVSQNLSHTSLRLHSQLN